MQRIGAGVATLVLATVMAACTTNSTSTPTLGPPPTAPPNEPTPVTGGAVVIDSPWGRIWDAVPPEFLVFAGAQPVEIDVPVSIALDHPAQAASPNDIASAYVTDMSIDGWQTVLNGPIEDGSIVLEAVRAGTDCRAQVKATPLGGVVRISILYGAGCATP